MMRWAQQGWERLSLYLPVLLMGLLALGTWWLVRNAPAPLAASQSATAPDQPDYSMKNFAVKSFDATGRLQSEVMGETARHYPGNDTLEIDQARMRSVAPNGRLTVARADRALSNGDGSEVQLFGNAVVTREPTPAGGSASAQPRLEFRGEFLHAFVDEERVSSDQPVELRRGADVFTGDRFSYDDRSGVAVLTGQVRGVLQPRR